MPRRPRQSRNNAQRGIRLADSDKQLIQASFGAVVQALVRQSGHTNKQLAGATGIPVATLQRSRRMDTKWYYPWDVASGCLWGPDGHNVELIARRGS